MIIFKEDNISHKENAKKDILTEFMEALFDLSIKDGLVSGNQSAFEEGIIPSGKKLTVYNN
jgi:hypothetical protein